MWQAEIYTMEWKRTGNNKRINAGSLEELNNKISATFRPEEIIKIEIINGQNITNL